MTDRMRVALLARPGQARDQLHRALEEAGVLIVAEGDPAELDPKDVAEKLPKVFLVGLEPATEKSIDRFDALFEAEGVEVMFDDAEITAKLDGWDLNRWARHLAGKLTGSELLPPVPAGAPAIGEGHDDSEDAGAMLQPGLPPTPAELMDGAKLEDYTSESTELADWVPTSPSLTTGAGADTAGDEQAFHWDGSGAAAGSGDEGGVREFKLDTDLGIDVDLGSLDFATNHEPEAAAPSTTNLEDEPIFAELGEGMNFSSFGGDAVHEQAGDLDADVAALAAQLEAFEKSDTRGAAVEPEFARAAAQAEGKASVAKVELSLDAPSMMSKANSAESSPARPPPPPTPVSPSGKGSFDFSNLSLAAVDGEAELSKAPPIEAKFGQTVAPLASKESSFGTLSLDGEPPAAPAPAAVSLQPAAGASAGGAVLILAGLGGPDAVRQLLSTLPERLSVPVLLYQHLEVGKHERLVEQLAKISKLPVLLAREHESPVAGKVTLLPAGMTAVANGGGLKFAQGSLSQLITALSPADSMVIVLSGADVQLVPMILTVKEEGGTVLAQDPEVCFDAAAAEAMRKEGAAVFPALGLARQVASRWPA